MLVNVDEIGNGFCRSLEKELQRSIKLDESDSSHKNRHVPCSKRDKAFCTFLTLDFTNWLHKRGHPFYLATIVTNSSKIPN